MKAVHIIITFFCCSVILSCTKEVKFSDLKIQYKDCLVVDGTISTERKGQSILLYHSSDLINTDSLLMESGAIVSITDGDTVINLFEKQKGVYVTNSSYAAKVNKTYTLNVKLENSNKFTASDYLYPSMIVDTMYSILNNSSYDIYIKAHSADNNQGAAVIMNLYANDSLLTSNFKDKVLYARGIFYEKVFSIPTSQLKKDTSNVVVQMNSISYQMYQYLDDVKNATIWSTEIFSKTQANARTNISNGGLGFFSASDVLKKQIVIVKDK
jgi:hypothetical protein